MPRPAMIDKEVAEDVAVRKVFLEPLLADRGVAEPLHRCCCVVVLRADCNA